MMSATSMAEMQVLLAVCLDDPQQSAIWVGVPLDAET